MFGNFGFGVGYFAQGTGAGVVVLPAPPATIELTASYEHVLSLSASVETQCALTASYEPTLDLTGSVE